MALATEEDGKEIGELKSGSTSEVAIVLMCEIMRARTKGMQRIRQI